MASGLVVKNASGGKTLNLDSWLSYDLSMTISGLFVNVVAPAGQSQVVQDLANQRINVKMSNNGGTSGFLTRFPISSGLAVHFVANSDFFTANYNFNNWFGCGFDERTFSATISSVNAFRFGWSNNRTWSALAMFFANGGWMVADGTECYFLDNDYNITAHITLDSAPTNLWFSDQKQDTGSTTYYLYIDQVKYK